MTSEDNWEETIEKIVEIAADKRFCGECPNYSSCFEGGNSSCGDEVKFYLQIENNKIKDVKFTAKGCTICKASSVLVSESIIGKNISDLSELSKEQIQNQLGSIVQIRHGCVELPIRVIKEGFGTKI
jgi:nitrogen fixation NifU-like protein